MERISSDEASVAVVGLGASGLSMARYLSAEGRRFCVMDTRTSPAGVSDLKQLGSAREIPLHLGGFNQQWLQDADEIWLSPGVSPDEPELRQWRGEKPVRGDIDVFSRVARAPIVAITGSNGKSTVTTLVGEMAAQAGLRARVGGNLGIPALDLLHDDTQLYVLEVSSFQLETAERLGASAATILNFSEDHLDRHGSLAAYHSAKIRVFRGCGTAVLNRDDPLAQPPIARDMRVIRFGLGEPEPGDYGLHRQGAEIWLSRGQELLLEASALRVPGQHNYLNVLAALALAEAAGIPRQAALLAARAFRGLPHRCEWVATRGGAQWFNDSKATNVGAALAALQSLSAQCEGTLYLILGGQGKGQNFTQLAIAVARHRIRCLLIGEDAGIIEASLAADVWRLRCGDLQTAIQRASELVVEGDVVLLSPACASLDQFRNYEARGVDFRTRVESLP